MPLTKGPHVLRKLSLALTLICGLASAPASADSLDGIWHLIATMGQRPPAPLLLTFQDGTRKFTGQAPCNRFFGTTTGHFPQLSLQNFGATRMACPDLQTETS
jgi:heat shock protein HslJ